MNIPVTTHGGGYTILLERGGLYRAGEVMNLHRKVLVVTDDGVPGLYAGILAGQCDSPVMVTVPQGEATKSTDWFLSLIRELVVNEFTRTDCVVAVGGGVVGDLAGFAAACYLRGIDFYNVPTTLLAQVDSSVGGKTAVDFDGYKNIVGAFWQPKAVVIDPDTLNTLPPRQLANGMAEAIKMSLTGDADLFHLFETGDPVRDRETVIERSLRSKIAVVERDEREAGLRKVLNFGHTLGHAIESADGMQHYLHGECVAVGMLPVCSAAVRARLIPVLEKCGLPVSLPMDGEKLVNALLHDKKRAGDTLTLVTVPEVGRFELTDLSPQAVTALWREAGVL